VVAEVRGAGLLLGLRINPEIVNGTVVDRLRDAGLLTVGAGDNVVRLLPPLIITETEIDEAIAILDKVLPELAP
jgi:acetylornithine/N-succinyldiaminopimelate aminotransferase